jgi:hypothetical protein
MTDNIAEAVRIARRLATMLPVLVQLGACSPAPAPEMAQNSIATTRAEIQQHGTICRPSPALLATPSAPDCSFGRLELKTLDPDRWARLKIEYERQCYQQAERTVREQLRMLQAASRC